MLLQDRRVDCVLSRERPRVLAEIGRDRPNITRRQQTTTEQQHDRNRPQHKRHTNQGEAEIAESVMATLRGRLGDDHVHRRPGQRKHRTGAGRECQRHQERRGRTLDPYRHHGCHRQWSRHRPVGRDQGRHERNKDQHRSEQQRRATAHAPHQCLTSPCRNTGSVEPFAHHEQRSDEGHGRIPESGEHLAGLQDAAGVQREGRAERDNLRRKAVRYEQRHGRAQHNEADRDMAHVQRSREP
jgi:hypothetical protein